MAGDQGPEEGLPVGGAVGHQEGLPAGPRDWSVHWHRPACPGPGTSPATRGLLLLLLGTRPLLAWGAGVSARGHRSRGPGWRALPVTESEQPLPEGTCPVPGAQCPMPTPWARPGSGTALRAAVPVAAAEKPLCTPSSADDSGAVGVHYRDHELLEVI